MAPSRLLLASLCVLLLQTILPSAVAQITLGTPPIAVGTPPVSLTVPPVSVSTPPISVSIPPVSVSTPPISVSTPPISVSTPPISVSTPPISVSTPPISVSTPPISVSTPPISVSTPPVSVTLSKILGTVVCDKCLDGKNAATQDTPLSGVQVSVNCTISNTVTGPTYVAATGTTTSDGSFSIGLSAAANAAFLAALYVGGVPTNGALSGAALTSCSLKVDSSDCPIQILDNGLCLEAGLQGNGETSALSLVNLGSTSADVSISSEICTAPLVKDLSCPAVSTPPTSAGTPPLSVSTPPISVSTPPISVSTPPISVSTPPISVSTPPVSVSVPGVTGDPHFTGADGSRFDFAGEPDNSYCLVSDAHLHINVFYGGRFDQWGDNPHKALTWIRQMGVLWNSHTVTFAARSGARWQYDSGYMARMEIDGKEMKLAQEGDSCEHAGGKIKVTWVAAKVQSADDLIDVYELEIEGVLKMRINLRPEIALLRTKTDGLVHIDFELPVASLSNHAHGILGQTFRRDHKDRLSHHKLEFSELFHALVVPGDNAEGFIDGTMADYRSSGLLGADCRFSRFTDAASRDVMDLEGLELTATRGQNIIGKTANMGRKMGGI